jgi:hypothetical protein
LIDRALTDIQCEGRSRQRRIAAVHTFTARTCWKGVFTSQSDAELKQFDLGFGCD